MIFFFPTLIALTLYTPKESALKPAGIFFGLVCSYAIMVYILGLNPVKGMDYSLDYTHSGSLRTGGLLGQAIVFAHQYSLAFALYLGLWLTLFFSKLRTHFNFLTAIVVLGTLSIGLSFTRGAWIAVVGAFLAMSFILNRKKSVLVFLASSVIALGLFFVSSSFQSRVLQTFHGLDQERVWILKANFLMFQEHPLFGVGNGQNSVLITDYYKKIGAPEDGLVGHAHNQYLNWLAGTGFFGFLGAIMTWLFFLITTVRLYYAIPQSQFWDKGISLGLFGSQIMLWLGGLTEANFEHSKIRYLVLFLWAWTIALCWKYALTIKPKSIVHFCITKLQIGVVGTGSWGRRT